MLTATLVFLVICLICVYIFYPLVIEKLSLIPNQTGNKDEKDLITDLLQNLSTDFLQSKISEAEYQELAKPLKEKLSKLK